MHQLNAAYSICLTDAQTYIKNYYDEVKPLDLIAKGISIFPQHVKVTPLSLTEYKVLWTEQTVQHGAVLEEKRWEATVQVELVHPADLTAEQRERAPLGVLVSYVNWFAY
jgi:type IV secretory pathway TrbF-like protein